MSDWLPVPGLEDSYEVNAEGTVRSIRRPVNSPICGGKRMIGGKVIVPRHSKKGYASITMTRNGKSVSVYVHRAVATLFVPNPDGKPHVNHIDGHPANNRADNLEWCTHAENMAHARRTGLFPSSKIGPGERSPAAKLSEEQVRVIKRRLLNGEPSNRIAHEYGVAPGTVGFIKNGATWAHVEPASELGIVLPRPEDIAA